MTNEQQSPDTPEPDAAGLLVLFQQARPELRRFVLARLRSEQEADDIIQDLWIKLKDATPGPVSNARAYFFRMANNLIIDRSREVARRKMREQTWSDEVIGRSDGGVEVADHGALADAILESRQVVELMSAAILKLPARAQMVLRMHKIEGLSHAEVAERLDISRNGVEKHMAVALKHLRRHMIDYGAGDAMTSLSSKQGGRT